MALGRQGTGVCYVRAESDGSAPRFSVVVTLDISQVSAEQTYRFDSADEALRAVRTFLEEFGLPRHR
jgi:hypothetical protein